MHSGDIAIATGCFNNLANFKRYRALTLEEFDKAVDAFCASMQQSALAQASLWLADAPQTTGDFFDVTRALYQPYVQKLALSPGTTIFMHGDLHADLHTLLAYISHLQKEGYMETQDAFTIRADKNIYIVFLGDYTDRGVYGTEVVYTLMRLKLANPERVILIRGNHEDQQITRYYGFDTEFYNKFSDVSTQAQQACKAKIAKLYNFLPLALYVGCQETFVQCCHGGLEIGFNPQNLLAMTGKQFQWLGKLMQSTECHKITQADPVLEKTAMFASLASNFFDYIPTDCVSYHPTGQLALNGFMWNDFEPCPKTDSSCSPGRGFRFNKQFTQAALAVASSATHKLKGVIRAHQHVPSHQDALMNLMLTSHGVARLWSTTTAIQFNPWDAMVITLLLSPDSLHGAPRDLFFTGFNWDTSIAVQLAAHYEQWLITVRNTNVYQDT
jgi:hypothetical protein